jgi:hypothetical protein
MRRWARSSRLTERSYVPRRVEASATAATIRSSDADVQRRRHRTDWHRQAPSNRHENEQSLAGIARASAPGHTEEQRIPVGSAKRGSPQPQKAALLVATSAIHRSHAPRGAATRSQSVEESEQGVRRAVAAGLAVQRLGAGESSFLDGEVGVQVHLRGFDLLVLDMRVIWLPPAETPWQTVTGALACYAVGV